MSLKNVKREEVVVVGKVSWRLTDCDGFPVPVFDEFCRSIAGDAFATRRRYAIVVSRFIDYLYEVEILGKGPVTRSAVNQAIDYYLLLLSHGENISLGATAIERDVTGVADELRQREAALKRVANRLEIRALQPGSWDNTLAALNRFLRLCAMLENEAREIAMLRGGVTKELVEASTLDYTPLLEAIDGASMLSRAEVQHIKQSSMLGGVIRFRGSELSRPRGLSGGRKRKKQADLELLEFPMAQFPKLLEATFSWRDKALWTLLAASGIRRSEALNLEWEHIDFENETVYVLDPDYTRYGRDLPEDERFSRFKGRVVSWTYLRQPYRSWFFEFLLQYRQQEYVLPVDGNNFVFQYLRGQHAGKPLREAADSTLNEAFTAAVIRAGIKGPPFAPEHVMTVHSLRHAYGMHMLNDFNVPGQLMPGLTEAEVQLLMGHEDINSTRKYARPRPAKLMEKLVRHDQAMMAHQDSMTGLPPAIASRLLTDAQITSRARR
ncbi:site-specific integrase [uncultured Dechloromonas sp.]|uniref:tyrosine-type recombinase/integrase n=1 Tax=uncultured Dechloromonas sp. TaxID=171719 RepID=UPI0025F2F4E2|nr:site-specific integrase [uncultured Dechloromonas sp.]